MWNPVSHIKGRAEDDVVEEVTGSKREDVIGQWRKQHNEEPYDSHSSPDNVRDIKLKTMRRMERVTRRGKERGVQGLGEETQRKETAWNT